MTTEPFRPPGEAETITYSTPAHLRDVRDFVQAHARKLGLAHDRTEMLTLAVNELVTNTLQHTDRGGEIRIWVAGDSITCDVTDSGPMRDFGRAMPAPDAPRGRGLAIVERLSDEVIAIDAGDHTIIRIRLAIDGPGRPPAAAIV